MLTKILVYLVAVAVAFAATAALLPDVTVRGGPLSYLWLAAVFAVVNATLGMLVRLVTLPLRIITLGLSSLLVNGFLLWVVEALSDDLDIDGFLTTIVAALVLSIVTSVVHALLERGTHS